MSTYVIGQISINDETRYASYVNAFRDVFSKFKGRLLSSAESPQLLEGDWMGDKVVLMEFPTETDALDWLNSPEYQLIAKDRRAGAETVALMVKGFNP